MPDFRWDDASGRYRDLSTGRYLAEARVREGVDAAVDLSARRMADVAARLRAGSITVEQFQAEMLLHVKDVHAAVAMAAHGGRAQMTPARWGHVGARVRSEYGFVRGLVSDILDGSQALNGSLDARCRQYARAGRITYETLQAREAAGRGYAEERNVLHATESCSECRRLAALGWVALGRLPLVGARKCGRLCRCTISRRRDRAGSEAA